jgi:hypothetical protein
VVFFLLFIVLLTEHIPLSGREMVPELCTCSRRTILWMQAGVMASTMMRGGGGSPGYGEMVFCSLLSHPVRSPSLG